MVKSRPSQPYNQQRVRGALALAAFLLFCLALDLRGCTHISHSGGEERQELPEVEASLFAYKKEFLNLEEKPVPKESTDKYDVIGVVCQSDLSTHPKNDLAIGYYYHIKPEHVDESLRGKDGKLPAIYVLPLLGGGKVIPKGLAEFFAAKGIPTLRMRRKREAFDKEGYSIEYTNRVLIQTVVDARKLGYWLRQRSEIDPERIGCIGASLGGMVAYLVDAADTDINTSVLVLTGGDLADILTVGDEKHLKEVREGLVKRKNVSADGLRAYVGERVLSLWDYTAGIDPSRVLMINARYDKVVPKKCAEEMWKRLGKPQVHWFPVGHISSVLFLPTIKKLSLEFLRQQLAPAVEADN